MTTGIYHKLINLPLRRCSGFPAFTIVTQDLSLPGQAHSTSILLAHPKVGRVSRSLPRAAAAAVPVHSSLLKLSSVPVQRCLRQRRFPNPLNPHGSVLALFIMNPRYMNCRLTVVPPSSCHPGILQRRTNRRYKTPGLKGNSESIRDPHSNLVRFYRKAVFSLPIKLIQAQPKQRVGW